MTVRVGGLFTTPLVAAHRAASSASEKGRPPISLTTSDGHASAVRAAAAAFAVASAGFAAAAARSVANAAIAVSTAATPTCAPRTRKDTLDNLESFGDLVGTANGSGSPSQCCHCNKPYGRGQARQ